MRARTTATLVLLAPLVLLGACADDGASSDGPGPAACVAAGDCPRLEPTRFAALAAQEGVVVLDVRTPAEFAEGHLEGATNLDVSAPDFAERVGDLDPDATYAVYCRTGSRSQAAATVMREAGIAAVADLDGGVVAWADAGLPLATD